MKNTNLWFVLASVLLAASIAQGCRKTKKNDDPPTPRTSIPDAFVGTWYYGDISNTNFYTPSNGHWENAVGSNQAYTFKKDGTFEFGFRAYVMVGTCSNVGMVYRSGTVSVEGNQLTLYDNYTKIMENHSCNPSTNYDKNGDKKTEVLILEPATDEWGNPGMKMRWPSTGFSFFKKK